MTDLEMHTVLEPDPEAIATARLVLPLVLTRLEGDPSWSLAMLDAVREQLNTSDCDKEPSGTLAIGKMLAMSPGEALAEAHACSTKEELAVATSLAQLALRRPDELGETKTNARLLLASLLERQGQLLEASRIVAQACNEDPEHENALHDRERILAAIRAKAQKTSGTPREERVAMLLAILSVRGWNFADAKAVFLASCGLLRGP